MSNNLIYQWLYDNRENLLIELEPLIKQYNKLLQTEDRSFFLEISDQFAISVREIIATEAGKALGCSPADIIECLMDLNLELYINGE